MSEQFQRFALKFKHNINKLTDEEVYKAYDETFKLIGFKDWTLTNFDQFKHWVSGEFLEVGCAGGRLLKKVQPLCTLCYGVDISEYALIEASQFVPNVMLMWADVEEGLPFASNSFDTVLCGHTLEHLRQPKKAFNELMLISRDKVIILIPLQNSSTRWKPTNLHIKFWPTIESFTNMCNVTATETKILREDTLAILLFRKEK